MLSVYPRRRHWLQGCVETGRFQRPVPAPGVHMRGVLHGTVKPFYDTLAPANATAPDVTRVRLTDAAPAPSDWSSPRPSHPVSRRITFAALVCHLGDPARAAGQAFRAAVAAAEEAKVAYDASMTVAARTALIAADNAVFRAKDALAEAGTASFYDTLLPQQQWERVTSGLQQRDAIGSVLDAIGSVLRAECLVANPAAPVDHTTIEMRGRDALAHPLLLTATPRSRRLQGVDGVPVHAGGPGAPEEAQLRHACLDVHGQRLRTSSLTRLPRPDLGTPVRAVGHDRPTALGPARSGGHAPM